MAFEIKQNDRRPFFIVNLRDDFGEPTEAAVNLTTATTAVFSMRAANAGAVKVNKQSATISSAASGEVTYQWAATDTDTVGSYEAEIEIAWSDGKVETFPNEGYWNIDVNDDIA